MKSLVVLLLLAIFSATNGFFDRTVNQQGKKSTTIFVGEKSTWTIIGK